jgi:hypothetical protein
MACDITAIDSLFEELSRRFKSLDQHSEKNSAVLHFKGRRSGQSGCSCRGEAANASRGLSMRGKPTESPSLQARADKVQTPRLRSRFQ